MNSTILDGNSVDFWHQRFKQQAGWTASLRQYIFKQINIQAGTRILEVGCGTGAVTEDLYQPYKPQIAGIDIHSPFLRYAKTNNPHIEYIQADGLSLPFKSCSFNLVICHFYLLWVNDPAKAVQEMARVTGRNGVVAALAEPDYGGRIDFPPALEEIARLQEISLQRQGADTRMGRQLRKLFTQAGLGAVHIGVLGGEWDITPDNEAWESEWQVLEYDLKGLAEPQIHTFRSLEREAWEKNERILYIPTFYAWGKVK